MNSENQLILVDEFIYRFFETKSHSKKTAVLKKLGAISSKKHLEDCPLNQGRKCKCGVQKAADFLTTRN